VARGPRPLPEGGYPEVTHGNPARPSPLGQSADLTVLEIILGHRQPDLHLPRVQPPAGAPTEPRAPYRLALAVITRLLLLAGMAWLVGLTRPLFAVFGHSVSLRDLILAAGGLFLLAKRHRGDPRHRGRGRGGDPPIRVPGSGRQSPRSSSWTSFFPWTASSQPSGWRSISL